MNSIRSSNNNCSNKISELPCHPSKLCRIISRKRRRYRNQKRTHGFLQRLCRRKERRVVELVTSKSHDHFESHLPSTERQQSIIDLHLNISDTIHQFKSIDHMIIVRATKNSTVGKQLQILLNNHDILLEQVIESQLEFTCHHRSKSVCILLDNHKQSDQYRSSFLHYVYSSLSNTLKMLIRQPSVRVTCMNLAFFNNSVCDIINMQRLRLIDTGIENIRLSFSFSMSISRSKNDSSSFV